MEPNFSDSFWRGLKILQSNRRCRGPRFSLGRRKPQKPDQVARSSASCGQGRKPPYGMCCLKYKNVYLEFQVCDFGHVKIPPWPSGSRLSAGCFVSSMAWLSLRLSGIRSLAVAWPLQSSSGLSWLCAEVTTSACSISAKLRLFSKPITDQTNISYSGQCEAIKYTVRR